MSVVSGQPTKIDISELLYVTGNSEIFRIIKYALMSNEVEYEEKLVTKEFCDDNVWDICYDLYMMEYNKIKFEFLVKFCDGELDKIFVNVKSIAADLCRSSCNDSLNSSNELSEDNEENEEQKDRALAASNQSIIDIWNKSGLKRRYECFNVRGLKKDKGEIKPGKDRFFCECDCFDIIMTIYRGEPFNAWISGDEFVMDPPRFVYVLFGRANDKNGWFVKIGSTNDINTRIKNIRNTECSVLEYEALEVAHGKTAEDVMRKKLHEYDFISAGGVVYKKEWLRFNKRCDAKRFFDDHRIELLEIGKSAKIGKFICKPQRVASKTIDIRRGFEIVPII